jgi:hypothetical protein
MLETSKERVKLLKAGIDYKTIENLYLINNNIKIVQSPSRKINCWDFVKCGREFGGEGVTEMGICPVPIDISADGLNEGKNAGRICWAVAGTFCGEKIQGFFAKKLLSCKSCNFFKTVKREEGIEHFRLTKPIDIRLKSG